MNQDEDETADCTPENVFISETVLQIFDCIFNEPMGRFKEQLEFLKENKYGAVWRDDNDRHEKVMLFAKSFIKTLVANIVPRHAEAAEHIEGSTCDLFLHYVDERLSASPLGKDPFDDSCEETKHLIRCKILHIKETLEAKVEELPTTKSDLEKMILKTELLDSIHIHHALLCCRVAYDCNNPEESEKSLNDLGKEHLLSELCVSYENKYVPKYVMARCGDVLYVSFKGIQSYNIGSTENSYRGEVCTAINKVAQKIPLKFFAREIIQNKRVVFSGHSSGGAVASLVFLLLLEKFKGQAPGFLKSHFQCITFGLMPLAGSSFKEYVEGIPGARDCFCHIVQRNDVVPKLFGSFNMEHMQSKLWKVAEDVLKIGSEACGDGFEKVTGIFQLFLQGKDVLRYFNPYRFDHLDIFGVYYILDTSRPEQKFFVLPASEASYLLRIRDHESFYHIRSQYLINHQIERYAHDVELALLQDLPDLKQFKSGCHTITTEAIKPQITEVRFENIGEEVVAKIAGSSMWFVYNVSIQDIKGNGKDLKVDLMTSSESEVQTRMREPNVVHKEEVRVRVKTHFQNSKYLKEEKVSAKTTTYKVSRRQQQLAKHSPRGVIELAYLSALLERRQDGYQSQRFKAIQTFFESAVFVVPIDSLFYAVANGKTEVMLQCCEIIISSRHALPKLTQQTDFLIPAMEDALQRINAHLIQQPRNRHYRRGRRGNSYRFNSKETGRQYVLEFGDEYPTAPEQQQIKKANRDDYTKLNSAYSCILDLKGEMKRNPTGKRCSQYNIDLEVIYPSTDAKERRKFNVKCCKAPMTLLTEGRKELCRISDELVTERCASPKGRSTSNANTKMLRILQSLRREFETCSTLLGAFMESQARIPLEKAGGDKYVSKIAQHASAFGLSVWGLLIIPFQYLTQLISSNVSEDFRQFVIDFSRQIYGIHNHIFPRKERQFHEYDEKLEFLLLSMKQSWTCNEKYASYSLERQLKEQCSKRNLYHNTPVDEILDQWNENFENETLTLVPKEYRRLVARWIKWSLMINSLRESLASQTAVGVIGLVNSGKSKFVRSMFGKETITGTTEQQRTTVPLIYNLNPHIKGMDVIDFPGVDDRDKSIPELAELLLSLTRIIIFVVDYRRAHTESTKEWLSILDKENVPVLICLTFADKLFAELMGENGDCDAAKVKAGVEKQLNTIKNVIGQPENAHPRDFKLTVFSFDNDSKLNTDEGKEKLRKAGLCDELDVGRWIAEKLLDSEENQVAQNVITFIEGKEKSTLNSQRRTSLQTAAPTGKSCQVAKTVNPSAHTEDGASSENWPTCSTCHE